MTVDHHAAALAALHALTQAYAWLQDEHATATLPSTLPARQQPQRLTPRAATRWDHLLRLERKERIVADRQGVTQIGATPMPIRPALLDAQAVARRTVTDASWIASSALRKRSLIVYGKAWEILYGDPWQARTRYLAIALPLVPTAVAVELRADLHHADRYLRYTLHVDSAWRPLPGQACPTCDQRTVEVECLSLSERDWTVRCQTGCFVSPLEPWSRIHGRDLPALISSMRKHMAKRERTAAA